MKMLLLASTRISDRDLEADTENPLYGVLYQNEMNPSSSSNPDAAATRSTLSPVTTRSIDRPNLPAISCVGDPTKAPVNAFPEESTGAPVTSSNLQSPYTPGPGENCSSSCVCLMKSAKSYRCSISKLSSGSITVSMPPCSIKKSALIPCRTGCILTISRFVTEVSVSSKA